MQAAGERRRAGATPTTPPSLPASDRRRDLGSDPHDTIPDAAEVERRLLDAIGHARGKERREQDPHALIGVDAPLRGPGVVITAPVLGLLIWTLLLVWAFG